MAKLSRKEKYQDLRDSLEQESEPQVSTKQARSTRMAAPDFKADQKLRGPVIEDLLGEVKQYNLDNGELVTDDTQMQILHDLSSQDQAAARRSVHFETMEQNEDVGGTTRNLYGSDLSSLMSNQTSRRTSQPIQSNTTQVKSTTASQTKRVQNEEPDFLDLFTPSQQANEEPMVEIVEEETKEKPVLFGNTRRKRRKATRQTNAQPAENLEKTLDSQSLDTLFATTEVPVNGPYYANQDDGPELPFTNRNQQTAYQEPVYEEEEYYEEEQPSGRFASLINKVRGKTRANVEEYEDEGIEEEEPPVVVSKKAKKASPSISSTDKSSQASKQQAKQAKSKPAPKASKESSSSNEQVSTSAIIFMVACCVILLLLILLTIFWMYKLGIF